MLFGDAKCTYRELSDPHRYVFSGKCIFCDRDVEVSVPGTELYAYRQGKAIQDAMPSVSAADREFLMTGICDPCFDASTKEDEEDDEEDDSPEKFIERANERFRPR